MLNEPFNEIKPTEMSWIQLEWTENEFQIIDLGSHQLNRVELNWNLVWTSDQDRTELNCSEIELSWNRVWKSERR